MDKYILLFVEGETEVELYKNHILQDIKNKSKEGKFNCKFDVHNVRGFGGFKLDVLAKFKDEVNKNKSDYEYFVFLCYDTDVFEIANKPLINWKNIEKALYRIGAKKVIHIKAVKCIEDWILIEKNAICKFLRVEPPQNTKGSAVAVMQKYLTKVTKSMSKEKKLMAY